MADARALLRAHRAENRIKHPHAAYSDAGKLLCKLCHEPIKTEALWESHIRSPGHRKRLQAEPETSLDKGNGAGKRKHDDVDENMSDADEDAEDAVRRKRSKPDMTLSSLATSSMNGGEKRQTPPELARRTSNTPVQGVEIAIPSRPATPAAGSNSATSTPKAAPVGRSPLIGSETTSTSTSTPTLPISTQSLTIPAPTSTSAPSTTPGTQAASTAVDEAEWAAFEAEIAAEPAPTSNPNPHKNTNRLSFSADATISAPALSAAQLAARAAEEDHERRKTAAEAELADEREDATRALEAEFEEMEELEGRVRRLKERREELQKRSMMNLRAAAAAAPEQREDATASMGGVGVGVGKRVGGKEYSGGSVDEDDEDEDEEEDDWDAFRLRR
ncbi:hypothetical protein GGS26DRAFT_590771 [Hypomontagnella submonticulosa]|nr:hypothetical protein GGS26DRAFT_590771 [Hypomontagnella submonticulosa]